MRKKMLVALAIMLVLVMVSGCTVEQLGYMSEIEKVNSWKSCDTDMKGTITVVVPDLGEASVTLNAAGKSNIEEMQAAVSMTIDADLKENMLKYTDISGNIKLPDMKFYMDKTKIYINKELLYGITELSGYVPEKLENMKESYIMLDISEDENYGEMFKAIINSGLNQQTYFDTLKKFFNGYDSKLKISKKGREYTIRLNSEQMADEFVNYINYVSSNQDKLQEFMEEYLEMTGLSSVIGTSVVMQDTNAGEIISEEDIKELKQAIKGSSLDIKYSFKDTSYTVSMEMKLKTGENFDMYMNFESESRDTSGKKVAMPKSSVQYTVDELNELLGVPAYNYSEDYDYEYDDYYPAYDTAVVDLNSKTIYGFYDEEPVSVTIKEINGDTYVPFRPVAETIGLSVGYDIKTSEIYFEDAAGQRTYVELTKLEGTSYISAQELEKYGFYVYVEDGDSCWYISW